MIEKETSQSKQNNNKALLILLLVILLLSVVGWKNYLSREANNSLKQNSTQYGMENEYSSEILDFRVNIQFQHQIKATGNQITISTEGKDIFIRRSATNYKDLRSYLTDLDSKNNSDAQNDEFLTINGYEAVKRKLLLSNQEKNFNFKIYAEGYIYTISTSSPELYDELDAIAQSFQYLGD